MIDKPTYDRLPIDRIVRCASGDVPLDALTSLLIDVVADGASIGFLTPLACDTARAYWEYVASELGGARALWVAESGGAIVGSIQLALATKENSRHRADLQKLFVAPSARGRGIASASLAEVERYAASIGRTLLVLDTETGSGAESLYRRHGWTEVGSIPNFALTPNGRLHSTTYYYKELAR